MKKQNLREGKELFTFNIIDDKSPISSDPAFEWFKNKPLKTDKKADLDWVCEYLDSLGFDTEKHYVSSRDLKTLEYVFEAAYKCWLPNYKPVLITDLLKPTNKKPSDYDNQHDNNPVFKITEFDSEKFGLPVGVYEATELLIEAFNVQGCIYAVNAFNVYLSVSNGVLSYSYQFIIGGRKLANIKVI